MSKASAIIQMRKDNPCATLNQIGQQFGITRERVRQILSKNNLATRHYVERYLCPQCGNPIPASKNWHIKRGGKCFCSFACWKAAHYVPLVCYQCGKLFHRKQSLVIRASKNERYKTDNVFCSRQCYGKWFVEHHGFGVHPENASNGRKRKWDYELIWDIKKRTGWGCNRIGKLLGIKPTVVCYIQNKMPDGYEASPNQK